MNVVRLKIKGLEFIIIQNFGFALEMCNFANVNEAYMKRLFLIFGLTILSCNLLNAKKIFVEMEFHKNSIKLDDGTNKKRQPIKDGDGKDLKFISLIGAMNYMSLQGWELVETKSVTKGSGYVGAFGGGSSTDTKVYYIFCKDVSDDELQEAVNNSYKE